MTDLTLLTKIYNSHQLKQVDGILSDLLEGLDVQAVVKGTLENKWVQIEVSGEDEEIATNLLEREIGFCPTSVDNVKKFAALKGYVTNLDKSKEELLVDVGVFQPKAIYAVVPLSHLQANLAEGKKVPLKRISEMWGFCENLPLNFKVLNVKAEEGRIEAELQAGQIKKFILWKASLLDRLLVMGASRRELDDVLEQEGLSRDVIDIEALGLFEYALVCKLGTDAAGLFGRVGRRLRKAKFTVFNPKKTMSFLEIQPSPTKPT